ncbi:SUMF1/EgtB/PvdO family nonheme iron enzyme [Lysobacter koreensis]|uniref:SUMF1/EgtB/PvdO family nonheme iron enzyme n=1 Tax=Lysobacter koreensis TaxID=266122 RepID=A0ABW2YM88_9GAMM
MAACKREPAVGTAADGAADGARLPQVTISADQAVSPVPAWRAPAVEVTDANTAQLKRQAAAAVEAGKLFGEPGAALPIYLALRAHAPEDPSLAEGFAAALRGLLAQGEAALAAIDDDPLSLRRAHEVAAVARVVATDDEAVVEYLDRLEIVDQAQRANRLGEAELNAGRIGEAGKGGALARFREALRLRPGDARANQGLAAAESALIRRAEVAAGKDDFAGAQRWLASADKVRPGIDTVAYARARIARQRTARIGDLRDLGIAALMRANGIDDARQHLAGLLRIAPSGDPAAAELRERIDLAVHYGLFRPGQVFTDGLVGGGRGPQMVVVPHGAFRMGAPADEPDATDAERPARNLRFDRGFAMSRTEVTVDQFRRFVTASGHCPRATRRGYSTAYDERSGNLVRRSGVDWRSDYAGNPAGDDQPVVHVSAKDATAYAEWLSKQTGQRYRVPSEAEFEYALRAGTASRFPWGDGGPPPRAGNFTGAREKSPSGRNWRNAFAGYDDGAWGPAAVGAYQPNRYGLHDLAGNVSEWVADCWHDGYRRAPDDGEAWVNPGCRTRVVRGGSWASSPAQTRSAWRLGSDADTTNSRVGFRVVRDI